jgi:hypothetical protein
MGWAYLKDRDDTEWVVVINIRRILVCTRSKIDGNDINFDVIEFLCGRIYTLGACRVRHLSTNKRIRNTVKCVTRDTYAVELDGDHDVLCRVGLLEEIERE